MDLAAFFLSHLLLGMFILLLVGESGMSKTESKSCWKAVVWYILKCSSKHIITSSGCTKLAVFLTKDI